MFVAYAVVTVTAVLANAWESWANFARLDFAVANARAVHSEPLLPLLGFLKGAAAFGLLLGLIGLRPIGIAAAVGLVLFFIAATGAHLRYQVYRTLWGPLSFLGLSVATLWLTLAA